MIHSFLGQLTGTNKELCQRLLSYAMRTHTYLIHFYKRYSLSTPLDFNLKVRTYSSLYFQYQNRAWHIVGPQQIYVK